MKTINIMLLILVAVLSHSHIYAAEKEVRWPNIAPARLSDTDAVKRPADLPKRPVLSTQQLEALYPTLPEMTAATTVKKSKLNGVAKLYPVLRSNEKIKVYSRDSAEPFQSIYVIDNDAKIYSTNNGGLDWSQFRFSLLKGKGLFSAQQLVSEGFAPQTVFEKGIPVAIEMPEYAARAITYLTPDFTYPGTPKIVLNANPGKHGRKGISGESGITGDSGKDGRNSGSDGGDGGNGGPGKNGNDGSPGQDGYDVGTVKINIDNVSTDFAAQGLWYVYWSSPQDSSTEYLLLYPDTQIAIEARGGLGGNGGAGGNGGSGGVGGNGGDGVKGRTGSRGSDGQQGYRGENGSDATANSFGTNGGTGGSGTDGSDGGRGGTGGDAGKGGNGGKGGKGGNGGKAGNGGDGGRLIVHVGGDQSMMRRVREALKVDLSGGQAGSPGSLGKAGVGGRGGDAGEAGPGGNGGEGGYGGPGGPGGYGGSAYTGYRYIDGIAVPYTNFGGINGFRGLSGSDGNDGPRGKSGDSGSRGSQGENGNPGKRGGAGISGAKGSLHIVNANTVQNELRAAKYLEQELKRARANNDSANATKIAEQKAEQLSPENSSIGSWDKVDKALQDAVEAASEGDDLDALERVLNKQIEVNKQ